MPAIIAVHILFILTTIVSHPQTREVNDSIIFTRISDVPADSILLLFGNEIGLDLIRKYTVVELNKIRDEESGNKVKQGESGLGSLKLNDKLNAAAQAYVRYLQRENYLSHTGKDGNTYLQRIISHHYPGSSFGEVIARGESTINEFILMVKYSRSHYNQVINPGVFDVGIGYVKEYWVVDLGGY